jgi:shikimate 5-dehydrogenase
VGAPSIPFAVRDKGKAKSAIEGLRRVFPGKSIDLVELRKLSDNRGRAFEEDIIINATPAGMTGFEPANLIDTSMIRIQHTCFDFIYDPRPTPFLRAATQQGAKTLDGLSLLVAQAQANFNVWTGRHFAAAEMMEELVKHVESEHGGGHQDGVASS